jgi:hypothetical protein
MKPTKSTIDVATRKLRFLGLVSLLFLGSNDLAVSTGLALDYSVLTRSAEESRVARYEVFRDFRIKGVCGIARLDLAAAYGANTLRTYTPPSREQLDNYQRMGLKVIVGIWMPHQGENAGKNGTKWDFDYGRQGDAQLEAFKETIDRIGDHPAILMWGLGNEVHLEPPYLQTVNRMSMMLHKKHPKQLSSITIINAPKDKIALIKQLAPDLDVIGFNSYGHGALAGASQKLEQEWGRAYYVSEFGPQGPWWGRKSAWGEVYEQSYDGKLDDLRKSFAVIDAAPRCLGSTMFLWGYWTQQKPTYFSALLHPKLSAQKIDEQELYITPMAEEFCRYWSGKYPPQRGPVLTSISVQGRKDTRDPMVQAGASFHVTASATDPDTPVAELRYRWWILDKAGQPVCGPVDTDQPAAQLKAPTRSGTGYFVMAYVLGPDKRASGFTVPVKVEEPQAPLRPTQSIDGQNAQRSPSGDPTGKAEPETPLRPGRS